MEENKSCYNCKYFIQHYVMLKYNFKELCCGHCAKRRILAKELYKFPFKDGCDLWEDSAKEEEKRKNDLCNDLRRMSKELHEIRRILNVLYKNENQ